MLTARQEIVLLIEPRHGVPWPMSRQLFRSRELLYFLVWRDVKVRYKQTVLGVTWALLQPLLTMLVFALLFGRLAGFRDLTGEVPYPLWVLSGLLVWTFFSTAVSAAGVSLLASASLVSKVFFPRLLVPWACVGVALFDLLVATPLLLGVFLWYGRTPAPSAWLAPVLVLVAAGAAAGVGAGLAAAAVFYRDVRHALPFLMQVWLFVSPVIYPLSLVPEGWRPLVALNPMAGVLEAFRASLFGQPIDAVVTAISFVSAVALLLGGSAYFASVERRLADVI